MKKRVNIYIDGFNLYYGICDTGRKSLLWQNIPKMCLNIIDRSKEKLGLIFFFTTLPIRNTARIERHKLFLKLNSNLGLPVNFIYGKFQYNQELCPKCNIPYDRRSEKRTDVAIGLKIIDDAYNDLFDNAIIISGDSDMVPIYELFKLRFPEKKLIACLPPKRWSDEINKVASKVIKLTNRLMKKSVLPDRYKTSSGEIFNKPPSWKNIK